MKTVTAKFGLPALIAVMGLLYIFFIPSDPEGVKLLFKLIPMGLIFAYAWLSSHGNRKRYQLLLLAGLVFCAVGDGTLSWFVIGLSAFLVGHLFYMAAFFGRWRFAWPRFLTILPIAAYSTYMGAELARALSDDGNGHLIVPVIAYVVVISLMAWSAIMSGNLQAVFGALLFVASDSILSWNMFVSDVPYAGPLIMLTYYSAQFLIAGSAKDRPSTSAGASISGSGS